MKSNALALSSEGQQMRTMLMDCISSEITAALPQGPHTGLTAARLVLSIVQAGERNRQLYQADPQSLQLAVLSMATLGLEADGVTGQGYLLPFRNRREGRCTVQPVPGYKGYNTLAARNGFSIAGSIVREGDRFEFELGTSPRVVHVPKMRNRAQIIAAYAIAARPGYAPIVEVLDIDELDAVRAKSPGARKGDSPWNDPNVGLPAMYGKTVKRRLARSMPTGWVPIAHALESQWEIGRQARVVRDEADGSPIVTLDREYGEDPVREGPPAGVLEGELVDEWLVHIPGKPSRDAGSPAAWATAMRKLIERNAGGKLEEFWKLNIPTFERLSAYDAKRAAELDAFRGRWMAW